MRKSLSGTGMISVAMSALALLKGMKGQRFTWRTAIAWLSWGLSLALSIGIINENRHEMHGEAPTPEPSKEERKLLKRYR